MALWLPRMSLIRKFKVKYLNWFILSSGIKQTKGETLLTMNSKVFLLP